MNKISKNLIVIDCKDIYENIKNNIEFNINLYEINYKLAITCSKNCLIIYRIEDSNNIDTLNNNSEGLSTLSYIFPIFKINLNYNGSFLKNINFKIINNLNHKYIVLYGNFNTIITNLNEFIKAIVHMYFKELNNNSVDKSLSICNSYYVLEHESKYYNLNLNDFEHNIVNDYDGFISIISVEFLINNNLILLFSLNKKSIILFTVNLNINQKINFISNIKPNINLEPFCLNSLYIDFKQECCDLNSSIKKYIFYAFFTDYYGLPNYIQVYNIELESLKEIEVVELIDLRNNNNYSELINNSFKSLKDDSYNFKINTDNFITFKKFGIINNNIIFPFYNNILCYNTNSKLIIYIKKDLESFVSELLLVNSTIVITYMNNNKLVFLDLEGKVNKLITIQNDYIREVNYNKHLNIYVVTQNNNIVINLNNINTITLLN